MMMRTLLMTTRGVASESAHLFVFMILSHQHKGNGSGCGVTKPSQPGHQVDHIGILYVHHQQHGDSKRSHAHYVGGAHAIPLHQALHKGCVECCSYTVEEKAPAAHTNALVVQGRCRVTIFGVRVPEVYMLSHEVREEEVEAHDCCPGKEVCHRKSLQHNGDTK